jgi:methylated-DNA-[protein]-cysteine S-methyltransferase
MEHYHIFETSFGPCGLAWSQNGVTSFQLPERDRRALRARMRQGERSEWKAELPRIIARAAEKLKRYFNGEEAEFSELPLDLSNCNSFHRSVYEAARSVGWGETATYGALARKAGSPRAARAVGHALARNPVAIIIPCHRILAAGAKIGGFSAHGGAAVKERLLALEGVRLGTKSAPQRSLFPSDDMRM